MSAAKFDVVVFLAHVFDAEIEQRFFKLKQECSDRCDVVVLVEQGSEVPPSIAPFTQFFDFSTLKQMAKSVIGENRRSPIAVCAFPTWEEVGRGRQRTGFVGIMSTVERCVAPAMAVRPSTGRRSVSG